MPLCLFAIIKLMGTSSSAERTSVDSSFPMQKYLNRGLTQLEIIRVKQAFDCFEPRDGCIDTSAVTKTADNSGDKKQIEKLLRSKKQLNFDEFFELTARVVLEKKKAYPDVEIVCNEVQPHCSLCPYAQHVRG